MTPIVQRSAILSAKYRAPTRREDTFTIRDQGSENFRLYVSERNLTLFIEEILDQTPDLFFDQSVRIQEDQTMAARQLEPYC